MPLLRCLPSLAAVLLLGLAACSSSEPQGAAPPQGSVQFAASLPQSLSASDATRVKVTVSASDMTSLSVELARSNNSWGGFISNIPAGLNRSFLAEAFDSSGTLRFQGQTSGVAINPNQTTAVAITLQELASVPPYSNEAPVVDTLVALPTTVQTGETLSLTSTVHDPNVADTLGLVWTAAGGTFSAPTAANTSWTAPSIVGIQTLTLTVTDSQGVAVSVSVAINVISGAPTNAALSIAFNLLPVVSKLSSSLSRLDAGQLTTVSATASDADEDSLTYQWAAAPNCPGTWTNATSSSASFVPSSVPAGVCNNCQLTVTVRDGRGGQATGSLNLCVATASTARFLPRFTNFQPSATSISPRQTVTFDVTALDPQSSSLTFAWSFNTGSLATAQNTATTSHAVWTAPACAMTGVNTAVTVTVTNAYGLSASLPFPLSGLPPCTTGWAAASAMSVARHYHAAALLPSGKVLVAGGADASGALSSTEVYDPATNSWATAAPMASARSTHTATRLTSGKVLVTGGTTGSSALSSTELYDPATNSWSSAGLLALSRSNHTATRLNSGKVLVLGGQSGSTKLAQAEVYDPATNSWASVAPMTAARVDHTATLLASGKVLVTGGQNASGELASAEVYDPATNSWASAGTLSAGIFAHAATLLNSGKVLLSGGYYVFPRTYAQLYDPSTNSVSSTVSMASSRALHTATLLASGKVLLSGGEGSSGFLSSTDVYDPANSSWSSAGPMSASRRDHTATLLVSGQVLVTGGVNFSYLSSADLYTP
jgi:N-acetylneuraminic acid mutarotase